MIKWDGFLLAIHIEPKGVRNHARWPRLDASVSRDCGGRQNPRRCHSHSRGEAVVLNAQGRSDFGALQRSLGGRGGKRASTESVLFAFDLLYFDGHDLTGTELSVRRPLLEDLLDGAVGAIQLSEEVQGDSVALLENARSLGLEGIIAKHRDSPYRSGRDRRLVENQMRPKREFHDRRIRAVSRRPGWDRQPLLADRRRHDWVYVSAVATGFKEKDATYLKKTLDMLKTRTPVVPPKGKGLCLRPADADRRNRIPGLDRRRQSATCVLQGLARGPG